MISSLANMTTWTSRQADQPVHGHANQPALPNACALQCMSVIYIVIDCLCPKFYTNVSFQKEHVCGGGQVQVMMVKATGDLRQEVKKVAVITPRFGAESTPAEKASSGLFSMLEVESDLKVTVTVQTSFGPITKFIKVDEEVMEVVNKNDERIHLPLSKISPRIDPEDSRLKKTILCLVEKGVSALASALNALVNKFHDESCKKEVSTSLTESVEDSSTRPRSPAMGTSSWRQ